MDAVDDDDDEDDHGGASHLPEPAGVVVVRKGESAAGDLAGELATTAQQLEDWADVLASYSEQGGWCNPAPQVAEMRGRADELWRLARQLDDDAPAAAEPPTDYARRMAEHSARRNR